MTGVCATASVQGCLRSAFEIVTAVRSRSLRACFCNLCNKWLYGVQRCNAALCPLKYISRFEYISTGITDPTSSPSRNQMLLSLFNSLFWIDLTTIQKRHPTSHGRFHICVRSRIRLCTNFLNSKLETPSIPGIHDWGGMCSSIKT